MTPYSSYLIAAFGFAAIVLAGLAWESWRNLRRQQQQLRALEGNSDEA